MTSGISSTGIQMRPWAVCLSGCFPFLAVGMRLSSPRLEDLSSHCEHGRYWSDRQQKIRRSDKQSTMGSRYVRQERRPLLVLRLVQGFGLFAVCVSFSCSRKPTVACVTKTTAGLPAHRTLPPGRMGHHFKNARSRWKRPPLSSTTLPISSCRNTSLFVFLLTPIIPR